MKRIFASSVLVLALVLSACQKKEQKVVSIPPTPASMVKAVGKSVPAYIATLGTTSSTQTVNIVPQVSGQIISINFKQGDIVKKGQILAVIDKRPFQAAVMQAEGNLRQAKAQLKIDELQVERNKKLAQDNYVNKQTYDTYLAQVEIDKGLIEAYKGALETAKINLGWCDIIAPTDGKIGLYNINCGNIAQAGSTVLTTIEYVDSLYVDFVIPSQSLFDAMNMMKKKDGKLSITVSYIEDDYANRSRKATANIVLNKIRYETGTAILRGELENSDHLFWPSQPVRVVLDLEEVKDAVLIPDICLQMNARGSFVYVAKHYKDGVYIAEQTYVTKGQIYDGDLRMVEGIKDGDWVVDRVSQLRLQAGPYVYRATDKGLIIGADGKIITNPQEMMKFMMDSAKIADELRGEMIKKMKEAAMASQAPEAALKAATQAATKVETVTK